ncbi:MAG TPA: alpha-amylase family glycosyl hydrolase, partial [Acidimicrobiales bacterium]|nr:alpha-amylase family glycosyl hydrolase [Acidimicrobiales bacterium]
QRGIRVIIDLVVNHTSNEHAWFKSARSAKDSPYRDWYVWSAAEPAHTHDGVVFPGVQKTTWTYDKKARAWYYHRFYDFQPDLNWANPDVRAEVARIIAFWLQLGVSGFRMDAAPFVIEDVHPDEAVHRREYRWLNDVRDRLSWRRGDAVILAEANVPRDELLEYFGDGDRLPMLFNFSLNQHLFLALARGSAGPVREALVALPTIPPTCTWATFLRNHDEVDLSGLSENERDECFAAFGPEESMQLYGRGIRRRLAPMLGGDRRRLELAYAIQCSLPGTPVLRYGEELGMGDDLSLPERNALRTPMQWSDEPNAGFSTASSDRLIRPVISGGKFGFERVNVDAQRADSASLLAWFERMLRSLRECPEFGTGTWATLDPATDAVLALRFSAATGTVVAVSNLADEPCTVDLGPELPEGTRLLEVFANRQYGQSPADQSRLELDGFGYRWLRVR